MNIGATANHSRLYYQSVCHRTSKMEDLSRRIRLLQWCLDRAILLNDLSVLKFREDKYLLPPTYQHFILLQQALLTLYEDLYNILRTLPLSGHRFPCRLWMDDLENVTNLPTRGASTATSITSLRRTCARLVKDIATYLGNRERRRSALPIGRVQLVSLAHLLEDFRQNNNVELFLLLSS